MSSRPGYIGKTLCQKGEGGGEREKERYRQTLYQGPAPPVVLIHEGFSRAITYCSCGYPCPLGYLSFQLLSEDNGNEGEMKMQLESHTSSQHFSSPGSNQEYTLVSSRQR